MNSGVFETWLHLPILTGQARLLGRARVRINICLCVCVCVCARDFGICMHVEYPNKKKSVARPKCIML